MSQRHIKEMLCSPPFFTLPSHPDLPGFGRWHTDCSGTCCRGWESHGDDHCQLTLAIQSLKTSLNLLQEEDLSSNLLQSSGGARTFSFVPILLRGADFWWQNRCLATALVFLSSPWPQTHLKSPGTWTAGWEEDRAQAWGATHRHSTARWEPAQSQACRYT